MKLFRIGVVSLLIILAALILVALMFGACASTKPTVEVPPQPVPQVEVLPQPIPPLDCKVYPLPGVDWAKNKVFSLDLQQVGKPETSRNQVLEKDLFCQITECLFRKGYVLDSTAATVRVRLYFGVKEEKTQTTTSLAYGLTQQIGYGQYSPLYALSTGAWTSSLAATGWTARTVTESTPVYTGEISIEVFDFAGKTQLWRGDVKAPLTNDDIRLASNWMIRELLWRFPALDYPAVPVPEVKGEDFERFWAAMIEGREFCSPGQPYPLTFNIGKYRLKSPSDSMGHKTAYSSVPNAVEWKAIKQEFAKTGIYAELKVRHDGTLKAFEQTEDYLKALQAYARQRQDATKTEDIGRGFARAGAAIADLLETAPWSVKTKEGTILIAGRYFVGQDAQPTIVLIEASPLRAEILKTPAADYEYRKYFITKIQATTPQDYGNKWREAAEFRDMALGKIDFVAPEPTPALRRS